jgi:two-component system CheB/CheR fusion protein
MRRSRTRVGSTLSELIDKTVCLYAADAAEPVSMRGPVFRLAPDKAPALGQALHELATNSVKYGALSSGGA